MKQTVPKNKKRKIANSLMLAAVALLFVCAILAAGHMLGWFGSHEPIAAGPVSGRVEVLRRGVSIPLKDGMPLRAGDQLALMDRATIQLNLPGGELYLTQNAEMTIPDSDGDAVVLGGTFLLVTSSPQSIELGNKQVLVQQAVLAGQIDSQLSQLYLLDGTAQIEGEPLGAGVQVHWSGPAMEHTELSLEDLPEGVLDLLIQTPQDAVLCFTQNQLRDELQRRKKSADTEAPPSDAMHATLEIRCNTLLENRGDLDPAKLPYLPADGVVLECKEYAFIPGETVFDLVKRACEQAEIPLEYNWTPGYGSYYIEGIHHLYEFDCGPQSGWMYSVNGQYPDRGCSACLLQDGDVVTWNYTCQGLGADLGAAPQ